MSNKITFELDAARLSRHQRIGGAAVLAAGRSCAAGKTLNVLSHKVHQTVLGTGDGDLLKDWRSANDADIACTTFDSNPLQDRLFREASLNSTRSYNVGYHDRQPADEPRSPRCSSRSMTYLKNDPIEDFDDIAPGLVQGMTVDGKLIGIPVRHATQGLFYNEALLEEAGISGAAQDAGGAGRAGEEADLHLQGGHAGDRHGPGERSRRLPGHVRPRLRRRLHHQEISS